MYTGLHSSFGSYLTLVLPSLGPIALKQSCGYGSQKAPLRVSVHMVYLDVVAS